MKKYLLFCLVAVFSSTLLLNAQTIAVYTENTEIEAAPDVITTGMWQLVAEEVTDAENVFEGEAAWHIYNTEFIAGKVYFTLPTGISTDLASYVETGYLNFAIKTATIVPFVVEFKSAGINARMILDETTDPVYGVDRDDNWHFINIPIADFENTEIFPENWNWTTVNELFTVRMHQDPAGEEFSMFIDNVFISMEIPEVKTGKTTLAKDRFSIFPTIVTDAINFSVEGEVSGVIHSLSGQRIKQFNKVNGKLNVADLPEGVYILSATSGNKTGIHKFIKSN